MTGRALAVAIVPVVLVALGAGQAAARRNDITPVTVLEVTGWARAVLEHCPGRVDDALTRQLSLSPERRAEVDEGLPLLLDAIAGPVRVSDGNEKRIADLGADIARTTGIAAFWRRMVLLHGDAAIMALQSPDLVPPEGRRPSLVNGRVVAAPMIALERDGEIVGSMSPNWNWAVVRGLLKTAKRYDAAFVARWIHATTAFLMSRRQFAEAQNLLRVAADVLPDDPLVLFDRAAYAEMSGMPSSQVLLNREDILLLNGARSNAGLRRSGTSSVTGIRPASVENRDAEDRYADALDHDPTLAEARVRRARLLTVRGKHDAAAEELTRAFAQPIEDRVLRYYAHLVGGRIETARGALPAAAEHYREALALFPTAQSALVGAGLVAMQQADARRVVETLRALDASAETGTLADPWWVYDLGYGRVADTLMKQFWDGERAR